MLKPLICLLILLSHKASAGSLTIYVTAPARELNWESSLKLSASLSRSYLKALSLYSPLDLARGTVGHAAAHISCEGFENWSSLSIKSTRMLPHIFKGMDLLFTPIKGAYLQSEKEIKRLIQRSAKRTRSIILPIENSQTCEELKEFIARHSAHPLYFSPLINTLEASIKLDQMGGTGATWSEALIKIVDPQFDTSGWYQEFRGERFLDPGRMFKQMPE